MNCYKLSYSCSKKRLNDLIHKGLEYEDEHGINETDVLRAKIKRDNDRLETALDFVIECIIEDKAMWLEKQAELLGKDLKEYVLDIAEQYRRKR